MVSPSLRERLSGVPALAFGVSGALAGPLTGSGLVTELVTRAYSGGIRIFDTAPAYGAGTGELRLGQALTEVPGAFVMTKAGVTSSGLRRRHRNFSPETILASVQASILRLDRRPIDLLWLHGPGPDELTPELIARLNDLREKGDVRHFGIAGRGTELLCALDHEVFEAVMAPVHSGVSDADRARLGTLCESGRIIFGIECMAQVRKGGVLSGHGGLRRGLQKLAGSRALRHGPAMSPEDALNWALDEGGADIVVTTTSSRQRLSQNLALAKRCFGH